MTGVETVFSVVTLAGDADYIGEDVSQSEHMRQAARLAQRAGADNELILAAFLHDIGHLCAAEDAPQMDGLGVVDHEHLGADLLLQAGFSNRVAELVRLHVQAKRYLCWRNTHYYQNLSDASRGTLRHQGGPMTTSEAKAFEQHPHFSDILRLRTWDEAAKVVDGEAMSLDELYALSVEHVMHQGA